MTERVVVFIDYMNTYKSAREAFGFWGLDEHWEGQIHPRTLGELTCARFVTHDVELKEVRVYRAVLATKTIPRVTRLSSANPVSGKTPIW